MQYTKQDRTIALAGIYQAAALVQQIARQGMAEEKALSCSIHSLFQVDAATTADVFGGVDGLRLGLRTLWNQTVGPDTRNNQITSYLLGLIHLERKLSKKAARLDQIHTEILLTKDTLIHFSQLHTNILARLAEIYSIHISSMQPRIMVSGEPLYLENQDNVNKIRSLLLAGIRAAMLWRQTGGRRRQLLLNKASYRESGKQILDSLDG
jgi:high frequency lysogenization protein